MSQQPHVIEDDSPPMAPLPQYQVIENEAEAMANPIYGHMWRQIQTEALELDYSDSFQTALMVAPHLVWVESNPFRYMNCHDGNIGLVAENLAHYWKNRVEVFGSSRAFKPLSLSLGSSSALSQNEIDLIRTGFVAVCPMVFNGRVILSTETSRRLQIPTEGNSPETRMRASFYIFQVVCYHTAAQTSGVYGCHVARCPFFSNLDAVLVKFTGYIHHFPLRCFENHLFDGRDRGSRALVQDLMQSLTLFFLRHRAYFHYRTDDLSQWVTEMEQMGFSVKNLPDWVGGDWNVYGGLDEWIQERYVWERERYAGFAEEQEEQGQILFADGHNTMIPPRQLSDMQSLGIGSSEITVPRQPSRVMLTECGDYSSTSREVTRRVQPCDIFGTLPGDVDDEATLEVEHSRQLKIRFMLQSENESLQSSLDAAILIADMTERKMSADPTKREAKASAR